MSRGWLAQPLHILTNAATSNEEWRCRNNASYFGGNFTSRSVQTTAYVWWQVSYAHSINCSRASQSKGFLNLLTITLTIPPIACVWGYYATYQRSVFLLVQGKIVAGRMQKVAVGQIIANAFNWPKVCSGVSDFDHEIRSLNFSEEIERCSFSGFLWSRYL